MNLESENSKIYKCIKCDKIYASASSLCNHKKKFHKKEETTCVSPNVSLNDNVSSNVSLNIITCKYCLRLFNHRSSKSRHEKNCNNDNNNKNDNKNGIEELRNEVNQLKELIIKNCKIHPKTLQKINKQLINNTNNNTTINNTNNNTTNIINNTYVKFGRIELAKILPKETILKILNRPNYCLEESIKNVHFNSNMPEYNNIFITNMKDNLAYIFDGKQFISVKKNEIIDEIIENHKEEIELSIDEYKDKMREFVVRRLQAFLDLMNDEKKYIDGYNTTYQNYKAYKMGDIKRFIYNKTDKKIVESLKMIDLKEKILS